jgi:aldehyde:ferredoxin oxidoreductase
MMYGCLGKILHVDLSSQRIWQEEFDEELMRKYLGGRGINSYLLWRELKAGVNPFSPENVMIFGAGTLAATPAPCSGRTEVTFKSPANNAFAKSSAGGHFSAELKLAGYDHLVIHGRADKPVYIWIKDGSVEICDAAHIWGKLISETHDVIYGETHDIDVQIAACGPTAETGSRIAGVMFLHSAAARGGGGAVMASKNLKAVAVRGSGEVPLYDPKAYLNKCIDARLALMEDVGAQSLSKYGTAGITEVINENYSLPSFNFRTGHIDNCYHIGGEALIDKGYLAGRTACNGCPIGCHRFTAISEGKNAGVASGGPEYETLSSLGSGCGVTDTEAVLVGNWICNEYGLDTISAGAGIQFAIECFERGLLNEQDTYGLKLEWGNGQQMIDLLWKIAKREEGLGRLLGEGVHIAAREIGGDAFKYAVESKGIEQSRVETRSAKGYALAFAVNPRSPDHLNTEVYAEFGATSEAKTLIEKITGDEKYAVSTMTEKRAEIVVWHEQCYAVTECLGMCVFSTTLAFGVTPQMMADMFSLATGVQMSEEDIMLAGLRVNTLEKCFNVREGFDRAYDTLPWRMLNEPLPEGPVKGLQNTPEELNGMLDEYYGLHGWDKKTSWPTVAVLKELNLDEQIEELEGKIGA